MNNFFDVNYRYKGEVFKRYKDFEWYLISNHGRVISLAREINQKLGSKKKTKPVVLKPRETERGYVSYILYKNGDKKQYSFRAHRLVWSTFNNDLDGLEINHKNANKKDNRLENLETCTRGQNMRHAKENGLIKSKLKKEDILFIRSCGKLQKEIASMYNISQQHVSKIINKASWSHV